MLYKQTVKIKNRNIEKIIDSFHSKDFIKFLISYQPVKIIKWNGIENNLEAHLKFWLFTESYECASIIILIPWPPPIHIVAIP